MIEGMTRYVVTLTVGFAELPDDAVLRDIAATWAARGHLDLAGTTTDTEHASLRLAAVTADLGDPYAARGLTEELEAALLDTCTDRGVEITAWLQSEVITVDCHDQRARNSGMPDLVDAQGFADLLGVKRQRVYQLLADARRGARDDFPLPVLDGHWLAATARAYRDTRRTAPGPAPTVAS